MDLYTRGSVTQMISFKTQNNAAGVIMIPVSQMRKCSTERLGNLPEVTLLVGGGAGIEAM